MPRLFVVLLLLCLAAVPAHASTWLVVSDIHLDPRDASARPAAYGADTNWALWTRTLAEMRAAAPHARAIVVAGDLLAHSFPHDPALAEKTMRRIEQSLASAFPGVPIVFALGNNDDPCGDYRPTGSGAYMTALAQIWHRPLAQGGFYTAPLPGARAVVLDDIYWSARERACSPAAAGVGERELTWLSSALATPQPKTVVVAHVPPGIDVVSTLFTHRLLVIRYLRRSEEQSFVSALEAGAPHIAFAIAGHAHRADFRVFGGVPIVIAPSVSPIYDNNPAFVVLSVGPGDALLDYAIYADDLSRDAWTREFDFDRAYGATRVDATTMLAAHERIASDPAARAAWESALVTGSRYAEVNASSWRTAWCAQTTLGADFEACAGLQRRLLVIPIAVGLLATVVLASIVSLALWYARR